MKDQKGLKTDFNPPTGIRSLERKEIMQRAQAAIRYKLHSNTDMMDDGYKYLTDPDTEIYPSVMAELLADSALMSRLEQRASNLKLNDIITFLNCGEDSVVFALGKRFVFRIAKAYNRAFDLDAEDIPSPMLKPLHHEILKGGQHGIRIMILPRLVEFRVPNQMQLMRINMRAMKMLGYAVEDEGAQNVMYFEGDENRTPVCMDYGVYKWGRKKSFNEKGNLEWVESQPLDEDAPGVTVDGYSWWALGEQFYPEYQIVDRAVRLRELIRQARIDNKLERKNPYNNGPEIGPEVDVITFD